MNRFRVMRVLRKRDIICIALSVLLLGAAEGVPAAMQPVSIEPAELFTSPARLEPVAASAAGGSCAPSATSLCLLSGRFQVSVAWVNQHPPGGAGAGTTIPVTDQSGNFWFFDPGSVEVVVKMVDGSAFNEKFWLFYGSLSDVEYTITVTDTQTGIVKTYHNAPGNICGGADTSAFDSSSAISAQRGVWGSSVASLTITDDASSLHILASGGCYGSYADITLPIPLGQFSLPGTYTQLIGAYPGKLVYDATFSGSATGNELTITVTVPALQATFGPFDLVFGVINSWGPCLYP